MKTKLSVLALLFSLLILSQVFAQVQSLEPSPPLAGSPPNKISLDIKGMDIIDVLKMLSQRSGLNIVVGKNVTGKVTLFLKDVEVGEAFEIILLANDLAYDQKGNIVNVMTQRDYELLYGERYRDKKQTKTIKLRYAKAADLSRALNQIKTNMGRIVVDEASNTLVLIDTAEKVKEMEDFVKDTDLPLKTTVFNLNYAQADKLSVKLQEVITKGVGSMRIDERTNKIAVTDYPSKLAEIDALISAFDEKTPQVLIDAQVVEIKPSDKFEMGVDWDFFIKSHFKLASSLPVASTGKLSIGTPSTDPIEPGDFKAILQILRTIGDAKVLSSPRIMVLNNQESKILVGTKEAYITSTTSQGGTGTTVTSQTVNFVDVGIKLYVTPTINRDGFVTMKIKPEISSAVRTTIKSESQDTQIPIVSTSEAETTVMVKDGVTIIIGGLRKDEKTKTVAKIPLIGDIPLLGHLFRNTSDEVKKTELVILLTPHIMSGETAYTDFAGVRPRDGAIAKMVNGEIVTEKVLENIKDTVKEYHKLITDKVKSTTLTNKQKDNKGQVVLFFTLYSDGQLRDEPEIISSSNQELDTPAIESIKSSSPFPAFPKELDKGQESFRITLEYN